MDLPKIKINLKIRIIIGLVPISFCFLRKNWKKSENYLHLTLIQNQFQIKIDPEEIKLFWSFYGPSIVFWCLIDELVLIKLSSQWK